MDDKNVYILDCGEKRYPDEKPFNPSINYPEYPFGESISKENNIYGAIRNIFRMMKLDINNFGSKSWNPLKTFVKPGDKVVIKPNMVLHAINGRPMESLITHGSIIRAMVDYVYIALKGRGEIVIADAPVQSCDFDKVIDDNGTKEIMKFYKNKNIKITLLDFRQEQASKVNDVYIKIDKQLEGDPLGYTVVDLKNQSLFKDVLDRKLCVTNYDPGIMKKHHSEHKHEYLIPNTFLTADVVINLPKPKTHKKSGVTACMKNMVGISGNKAWLPHHSAGSKDKNGDEYLQKNIFKSIRTVFVVKRDLHSLKGRLRIAKMYTYLIILFNRLIKTGKPNKEYIEGNWWGNDTIWRTVYDLNLITLYADRKGEMTNKIQRKSFSLCDMIISGEKEGPVRPSLKEVGIIVAGVSPLVVDTVITTVMGFDIDKLSIIRNGYLLKELKLTNVKTADIEVISNKKKYSKKMIEIKSEDTYKFIPSSGWLNYIEMEEK